MIRKALATIGVAATLATVAPASAAFAGDSWTGMHPFVHAPAKVSPLHPLRHRGGLVCHTPTSGPIRSHVIFCVPTHP